MTMTGLAMVCIDGPIIEIDGEQLGYVSHNQMAVLESKRASYAR